MTPYTLHLNKSTFNIVRKLVAIVVLIAFFATSVNTSVFGSTPLTTGAQPSQQALLPWMPQPGVRISLSPEYTPAHLQGMVIHPENALLFDFIINRGDQELAEAQKEQEYKKLVKYFLASLAIPDDNQWVNLSPYEKDRIIKDDFGKTEMGRDLLSQDYILKQITASMIYPESNLGQKFWEKVYSQAYQQFGKTTVPVNTFNKVWIIPDEAVVYEHGNTVYVLKNHLKVMLEEDYLSLDKHSGISNTGTAAKNVNKLGSEVVREIVLPALEKEVNEGKNFAALRQVYSAMILAAWYKRVLKESLLGKIYLDRSKIKGVDQQDTEANHRIYQQYLTAFKKGVFNYIKEDVDRYTKEPIPRKYFSGGAIGCKAYQPSSGNSGLKVLKRLTSSEAMIVQGYARQTDEAMVKLTELLEPKAIQAMVAVEMVSQAWKALAWLNSSGADNQRALKTLRAFLNGETDAEHNPIVLNAPQIEILKSNGILQSDASVGEVTIDQVISNLFLLVVSGEMQKVQVEAYDLNAVNKMLAKMIKKELVLALEQAGEVGKAQIKGGASVYQIILPGASPIQQGILAEAVNGLGITVSRDQIKRVILQFADKKASASLAGKLKSIAANLEGDANKAMLKEKSVQEGMSNGEFKASRVPSSTVNEVFRDISIPNAGFTSGLRREQLKTIRRLTEQFLPYEQIHVYSGDHDGQELTNKRQLDGILIATVATFLKDLMTKNLVVAQDMDPKALEQPGLATAQWTKESLGLENLEKEGFSPKNIKPKDL
ncbi:MAG: hypothetical protein WCH62_02145, partial [Candidatus Omnitrophota bacterium]